MTVAFLCVTENMKLLQQSSYHSIIYCHDIHWHYGMSYNTGKAHALHQLCEAYTIVHCSWQVPQYYYVSNPQTSDQSHHHLELQTATSILIMIRGLSWSSCIYILVQIGKRNWSSLLLPTVMTNLTEVPWVRFSSSPWKAEQQLL
jgi:hypothetical protein